jgi:hypothetical protein
MTIADLRPYATRGAQLWNDGFIARWAFVTPTSDPVIAPGRSEVMPSTPVHLTEPLVAWHQRLGIPHVTVEEITSEGGLGHEKRTGTYKVTEEPHLPETTYRLPPSVRRGYDAYKTDLMQAAFRSENEDLDASYGRFADMALKIAALLSSLHDERRDEVILPSCWHRRHQIAERWRTSLHRVQAGLAEKPPSTIKVKEEKILRILTEKGANGVTARQLQQTLHLDSLELKTILDSMVKVGALTTTLSGKTRKYIIPREDVSQV